MPNHNEAIIIAAREEWAIRCHCSGAMKLERYTSDDVMEMNRVRAERIIEIYLRERMAFVCDAVPVAFEICDTEDGKYLTRSRQAAYNSGYDSFGLHRLLED